MLAVGPGGRLRLVSSAQSGATAVVIARAQAVSDSTAWRDIALLAAPDGKLRVDAQDEPREVVGVRARVDPDGRLRLQPHGQDGFLGETEQGLSSGVPEAAAIALMPIACPRRQAGPLALLPDNLDLDFGGLAYAFALGDRRLLPILDAWLSLLPVDQIRLAWSATVAIPARDVFFALVRDHGRRQTGGFQSYTADLLKAGIEAHGWQIGEGSYGMPLILEPGRGMLRIGRYCSMAAPTIVLGNHSIRSAASYPFVDLWKEWPGATAEMSDHVPGDVVIGNDVWIGAGVTILPHARIGDGAVIGAGCVVRGEVPPYAICMGNPAVVRRMRFEPAVIERLLRLRWWDWPPARLDRYLGLLTDERIEHFLAVAEAEDSGLPIPQAG